MTWKLVRLLCPLLLCAAALSCSRPLARSLPPPQPPLRFAADTHVHLTMNRAARPVVWGAPGSGDLASAPGSRLINQVEAAQLFASGTVLTLATVWAPPALRPSRDELTESIAQLDALHAFTGKHSEFAAVHSVAEARAAIAHGRLAMVPAIEGGEAIHSVEDVDRLYAAGARSITLVHFVDNGVGGAAATQLADNLLGRTATSLHPVGLSVLGRAAVAHMFELGMLVDLAHASDLTSQAVLELAEARGVPVINSHSAARALSPRERNISDQLAARIAQGGGVIGITISTAQVKNVPAAERFEGFVAGTCDEVVAHWLHLAAVAGPAALTLGSDFNGFTVRPEPGGSCPHGLRNAGDVPELFAALQAHGAPREALDGMAERVLSTWAAVDAKADRTLQAMAAATPIGRGHLFDVAQ